MTLPMDMKGREGELGFPPVSDLKGRRVSPPAPACPPLQSDLPSGAHLPLGAHRWASDRQLLPPFSGLHSDGVLPDSAWAQGFRELQPGPLACTAAVPFI